VHLPDELLADQGGEVPGGRRPRLRREKLGKRVRPELLPHDRHSLEHGPLAGAETVEAGGEQRLDRRRNRQLTAELFSLGHHGQQLLQEQRVSLCHLGYSCARGIGEPGAAGQRLQQGLALLRAERLQQERRSVRLAASPEGPLVEKLGPGETDEQERCVVRPVR